MSHPATWFSLSQTLHIALMPKIHDLGFTSTFDLKKYAFGDDEPHRQRFVRPSTMGWHTFNCSFSQGHFGEPRQKYLDVSLSFGVHIAGFEELEIKLDSIVNPLRLGRRLSHISRSKHDVARLTSLDTIDDLTESILIIVQSDAEAFWSDHNTLDDVEHYFTSQSRFARHSPRGAPQVSRYLMWIALLKRDRAMFDSVVKEYRKYMTLDIYVQTFEDLVQKVSAEFDNLGIE